MRDGDPSRIPDLRRKLLQIAAHLGLEPRFLRMRRPGFARLSGFGIEIGAFEHPARLPRTCSVKYADVLTLSQVRRRFPEVDVSRLVKPDVIIDLDAEGMSTFATGSLDFVIACHVIEHVANPGRFIEDIVRALRVGGHMAIAAPDKSFTFDHLRQETPLVDLERYYRYGRTVSPEDYTEMLTAVHPEILDQGPERISAALHSFRERREHLSVWTASSFRTFLLAAFEWCGAEMVSEYEVMSDANEFEYFGVWRLRRK